MFLEKNKDSIFLSKYTNELQSHNTQNNLTLMPTQTHQWNQAENSKAALCLPKNLVYDKDSISNLWRNEVVQWIAEENMVVHFYNLEVGKGFLNMTLQDKTI